MGDAIKVKNLVLFAALFLVCFAGRLYYGYTVVPDEVRVAASSAHVPDMSRGLNAAPRNYEPTANGGWRARLAVAQTATRDYDRDAAALRAAIAEHGGSVQHEEEVRRSDKSTRAIAISAAIPSSSLEKFLVALHKIGKLQSSRTTMDDATDERTAAEQALASLEETRRALLELRRSRGPVDKMAELQRQIADVDRQLRTARARAASFGKEALTTAQVVLYEDFDVEIAPPSRSRRVMIAFKWAAKYSLVLTAAFGFFSMFMFFISAMARKMSDVVNPRGRHVRRYGGETVYEMPATLRIEAGDVKHDDTDESSGS